MTKVLILVGEEHGEYAIIKELLLKSKGGDGKIGGSANIASCIGKQVYLTPQQADRARRRMQRSKKSEGNRMGIYKCNNKCSDGSGPGPGPGPGPGARRHWHIGNSIGPEHDATRHYKAKRKFIDEAVVIDPGVWDYAIGYDLEES